MSHDRSSRGCPSTPVIGSFVCDDRVRTSWTWVGPPASLDGGDGRAAWRAETSLLTVGVVLAGALDPDPPGRASAGSPLADAVNAVVARPARRSECVLLDVDCVSRERGLQDGRWTGGESRLNGLCCRSQPALRRGSLELSAPRCQEGEIEDFTEANHVRMVQVPLGLEAPRLHRRGREGESVSVFVVDAFGLLPDGGEDSFVAGCVGNGGDDSVQCVVDDG